MLINEVEYKVGLSKKSIRYYESEGLLNVKRNSTNDYRNYTEDDIKNLKMIKFLRELGVPIQDIKKLNNNIISLQDCMQERLSKIKEMESNFIRVKNMCLEIINSADEYHNIDITKYAEVMNVLNKKGFTMKDMKKSDKKKIWGACLSSLVFGLLFILLLILFTYIKVMDDSMPWIMYIIFMFLFSLPLLAIIVNLISRIKEIKGGEENEASKY